MDWLGSIPSWVITSIVVILAQIVAYTAFRVGTSKDVSQNRTNIERNDDNVGKLYEKTDELEKEKLGKDDFNKWHDEMKVDVSELKSDFRLFRTDITGEFKTFKKDVVATIRENGSKR